MRTRNNVTLTHARARRSVDDGMKRKTPATTTTCARNGDGDGDGKHVESVDASAGAAALAEGEGVKHTPPQRRRRQENEFDRIAAANDVFVTPPCIERDYVIDTEVGVRFVVPYDFDFICGVKARWTGQRLCALFASEFSMRPLEYYRQAHARGALRIEENARVLSGKKASSTPSETHVDGPILQNGNRVRHFLHRHEPPVLAGDIEVLDVSSDVISVSKPATVPVHPTGQYRKNTVLALLAATRSDLGRLYPIHRLDKNVSGLLILARSSQAANAMRLKMEAHEMRKEYVARVSGIFNNGDATAITNNAQLGYDAKNRVAIWHGKETKEPFDERLMNSFKDASTKFTWMKTLSDGTSMVKCEPLTGRQHQIRAHLAMLGYPIANDVAYGGSLVEIELARRIQFVCDVSVLDESGKLKRDESLAIDYGAPRQSRETSTEICQHCPRIVHAGDLAIDLEAIWLHCVRYSGPGWEYTCSPPSWA